MKQTIAGVVAFLVVLAALGPVLTAASVINEVGLSFSVSPSRTPVLLGIEIGISSKIGWTQFSLMLSPSGGMILHGAFLLPLGTDGSTGTTHLAFAVALFQEAAVADSGGGPDLCFGAGLSQRYGSDSGWMFAAGVEFLYPALLTMPLFLVQGGWRIV
ncbi:hypothetical protein JW848_04685 [Candidatus Bipolaricaulota bacterium]|nr:hypothetical protein [Candidatus Bipolaricaulota bacterium]